MTQMPHWPYPCGIAHRGAGKVAPENTLAAFRAGAALGWRMFECDVQLSADDVPFLLHDSTLERTTTGIGRAGALPWSELKKLDAGKWHSPGFSGEPIPTLEQISDFCLRKNLELNIEIKPTEGTERLTGKVVAEKAAFLWKHSSSLPILTSFNPEALAAAREVAPHLPRGLLVSEFQLKNSTTCLEAANRLNCRLIGMKHSWVTDEVVKAAKGANLRLIVFTVNELDRAQELMSLGVDGIITDEVKNLSSLLTAQNG